MRLRRPGLGVGVGVEVEVEVEVGGEVVLVLELTIFEPRRSRTVLRPFPLRHTVSCSNVTGGLPGTHTVLIAFPKNSIIVSVQGNTKSERVPR